MADRSVKAKKGTKKQRTMTQRGNDEDSMQSPKNNLIASELLHGLSEKEVEIDHLKTTVVSLNTKVEVLEGIKEDRESARAQLKDSEGKREELHDHMKETTQKLEKDTEEHKTF